MRFASRFPACALLGALVSAAAIPGCAAADEPHGRAAGFAGELQVTLREALGATVTVGRRTVRFDGRKIILGPRPSDRF